MTTTIVTDIVDEKMRFIQVCALRGALRLEIAGMKRSRSPSAYVIAKRDFGLKGSRQSVLEQLQKIINDYKENMENVVPIGTS